MWLRLIFLVSALIAVKASEDEKRLQSDLFSNYDHHVRPSTSASDPTPVHISVAMIILEDVDPRDQTMTFSGYTRLRWNDPALVWNAEDYGNVNALYLSPNVIWVPDVMLFNDAGLGLMTAVRDHDIRVQIHANGDCLWVVPTSHVVHCIFSDLKWARGDEHMCRLMFGSWAHPTTAITLQVQEGDEGFDLGFYRPESNRKWKVTGSHTEVEEKTFPCCPDEKYGIATYVVHLKRQSLTKSYCELRSAMEGEGEWGVGLGLAGWRRRRGRGY